MDYWGQQIFRYCERGQNPAFWGEPLNAISNGAFLIAAALALWHLARQNDGRNRSAEFALCLLVGIIGIGSFLFHTFATLWAVQADVIPIAFFTFWYVGYALRRFFGLGWIGVVIGLAAFAGLGVLFPRLPCPMAFRVVTEYAQGRCLNGTIGYAPAFIGLIVTAAVLGVRRHPAWVSIALASVIFLAAMTFRTVDIQMCDRTIIAGVPTGTHFMWHMLNGLTLYILLVAAIRHGQRPAVALSAQSTHKGRP